MAWVYGYHLRIIQLRFDTQFEDWGVIDRNSITSAIQYVGALESTALAVPTIVCELDGRVRESDIEYRLPLKFENG